MPQFKCLIFVSFTCFIVVVWLSKTQFFATVNIIHSQFNQIISFENENWDEKEFRMQYFYANSNVYGKPFDHKWNRFLKELSLLNFHEVDDEAVLKSEPVIVTAASSNHYKECLILLSFLEKLYNNTKIVFVYDLGLNQTERDSLLSKYNNIIKEIRTFAFGKYPPYFTNLRHFRWKPLVVAEMLKEFPSIFWLDSSVRVYKNLSPLVEKIRQCNVKSLNSNSCDVYPWLLIIWNTHSIYAATDPVMYEYFPMPIEIAKNLTMWPATMQLIFATNHVKQQALRYWVLCALEDNCMWPKNSTIVCSFSNKYTDWAKCHRQDQSAINAILAALNNFNESKYHDIAANLVEKFL